MPGRLTPLASRVLPPYRPWFDSTRPIAPIRVQSMRQPLSAVSMTWAARWYAERAAAGMPFVDAAAITAPAEPTGTPGAISPGLDTLAGAWMAGSCIVVPSASRPGRESALALLVTVRLVVHAPESRASGTSAVAFCQGFKPLGAAIRSSRLPDAVPDAGPARQNRFPVFPPSTHANDPMGSWLRAGSVRTVRAR